MKKLLATLLTAALCAAMIPMAVSADGYTRGEWTKDGNNYTSPNTDVGNSFVVQQLGESDKVTLTATVEIGKEQGFMFAMKDENDDGLIDEAGDQYYLIDVQASGVIGIERNDCNWAGGWAATSPAISGTVTLTVTYDNGAISVSDGDNVLVSYNDPDPFTGTAYGLCAKRCEATFTNVTFENTAGKIEVAKIGEGSITVGENGGNWIVDGANYTAQERVSWPNFSVYGLGNADEKVTLTATLTVSAKGDEATNNGADAGFLFAVADVNDNKSIEEGADYYYLVEIACSEDAAFIGISRNAATWGGWAAQKLDTGYEKGEKVTFSATYDPATATIIVSANGEKVLEWTDGAPLAGTGYGLCTKITGGVHENVVATVGEPEVNPPENPGDSEKPEDPVTPPQTGSAVIALSVLGVVALGGVVIASKKREQD
ncbi:MAG: NPXTG-anchored protein [Eubacteriales bacterium]